MKRHRAALRQLAPSEVQCLYTWRCHKNKNTTSHLNIGDALADLMLKQRGGRVIASLMYRGRFMTPLCIFLC
jgi:hypothetical protein